MGSSAKGTCGRAYSLEAGLEAVLGGGELRGERLHARVEIGQEAQLRLVPLLDLCHQLLAHLRARERLVSSRARLVRTSMQFTELLIVK